MENLRFYDRLSETNFVYNKNAFEDGNTPITKENMNALHLLLILAEDIHKGIHSHIRNTSNARDTLKNRLQYYTTLQDIYKGMESYLIDLTDTMRDLIDGKPIQTDDDYRQWKCKLCDKVSQTMQDCRLIRECKKDWYNDYKYSTNEYDRHMNYLYYKFSEFNEYILAIDIQLGFWIICNC